MTMAQVQSTHAFVYTSDDVQADTKTPMQASPAEAIMA